MTIVIRSSKQIVALHDGIVYIFSVEALEGIRAIPKEKNTKSNIGRRIVGFCIDPDDFKRYEVFKDSGLVSLLLCKHTHVSTDDETGITSCPDCGAVKQKNGEWDNAESVVITKKRLKMLEYRDRKLSRPEAAGLIIEKDFDMQYTNLQKHMLQFFECNRRLHMPTLPGMGMSVLPIEWARTGRWIGSIIYITPKSMHNQTVHEIKKRTGVDAQIIVGMKQPIPLFISVIIITPETLRLRLRELGCIKPLFVVTYNIRSGWDNLKVLCNHAERVCILGNESNDYIRRIVR